jgi:hypothetical protein
MKKLLLSLTFFTTPFFLFAQSVLDNTQLRLFSHAEYSAVTKDTTNKFSHSTYIGDVELLITSQVTDKLSVLAEIIHASDGGTVEIDRLMLRYQFNDYFHLSAGKLYTPLGLWNTTFYHQARVLSPTIDHPVIIADESDFGILENKAVGIQLGGENISKARFGYRVFVNNGASDEHGNTQRLQSVSYNFFIEPIDNFKVGISGQYDDLAAGSFTHLGKLKGGKASLNVFNASIMYMGGSNKFEFASEYYQNATQSDSANTKSMTGFFAYAGYKFANNFTPYYIYNKVDFDKDQLFYENRNFTGSTLGLRYNISSLAVLKLEAQFLEGSEFQKLNRIEVMWAIGF